MCLARRVLVVDDDVGIRLLLNRVLTEEGYTVRQAAHGAAALAWLPWFPPCLILLDLRMPGMDAPTFVAAARQAPGPAAILVLSAEPDGRQRARALGATGFARKPFDLEELLASVDRHVAAHVAT